MFFIVDNDPEELFGKLSSMPTKDLVSHTK